MLRKSLYVLLVLPVTLAALLTYRADDRPAIERELVFAVEYVPGGETEEVALLEETREGGQP